MHSFSQTINKLLTEEWETKELCVLGNICNASRKGPSMQIFNDDDDDRRRLKAQLASPACPSNKRTTRYHPASTIGLFLLFTIIVALPSSISSGKVSLQVTARRKTKRNNDPRNSAILQGRHPHISYVTQAIETEEGVTLRYESGDGTAYDFEDVPRFFWELDDQHVEEEVAYRMEHGEWSDGVVMGRIYFGLVYGLTGLPQEYNKGFFETSKLEATSGWDLFSKNISLCNVTGIVCENEKVVELSLPNFSLQGTLPNDLTRFSDLERIVLYENQIHGTIPSSWTKLKHLSFLDLGSNKLNGTIPRSLAALTNIYHLDLSENEFRGPVHPSLFYQLKNLSYVDLSENSFSGRLPLSEDPRMPLLKELVLEDNKFSGHLPNFTACLQDMEIINFAYNDLSGTIPTTLFSLPVLRDLDLSLNKLSGKIPTEIMKLTMLQSLRLSHNQLTGPIPRGDDIIPGVGRTRFDAPTGGHWSDLARLKHFIADNNNLTGILPPEFLYGISGDLSNLNVSLNALSGSIPAEIGKMTKLANFDGLGNRFTGSLPSEMSRMNPNLRLNLADNMITGTVPKIFCGGGQMSTNLLFRQFGCDAILCPAGTFHPSGAATLQSGCRPCPVGNTTDEGLTNAVAKVLGRTECRGVKFIHGDLNGDGILTPREILRLLYADTIGRNWGAQFQTWADVRVNECDLNGITCVDGEVIKIDLTDAAMCSDGERKVGPKAECRGIPSELSQLSNLEIITMNRRQFLRGSIPSELGKLTKLRHLDLSNCASMEGTIPSELGLMSSLRFLGVGGCNLHGTIPGELFELTLLEKLHLSMNPLTGSLPHLKQLPNLKELMVSRTQLTGTIPQNLGSILPSLENLEMYGNQLVGSIPSSLSRCSGLKRIDLFNNKLTGALPESLTEIETLQILHLKNNRLTGSISPNFGALSYLTWLDLSHNRIHGTIPGSFGSSRSLKDFRLGNNMIYEPIPPSLCVNTNINGGLTRQYGCDGVICPLGTYSDPGHATHSEGCKPCPEGKTTMYLGSSSCEEVSNEDILAMLYEVMGGEQWGAEYQGGWKDKTAKACDYQGVICDKGTGQLESLRLSLMGAYD